MKTEPEDSYKYATILAALVVPCPRGAVRIKSSTIKDLPITNISYLHSLTDQAVAIAAYERLRSFFATKIMSEIVIGDEYYIGKEVQTDERILEIIKCSLQTMWHAACTCKDGEGG